MRRSFVFPNGRLFPYEAGLRAFLRLFTGSGSCYNADKHTYGGITLKRMPGSAFSQISGDREALRLSAVSTLVFGLLAHGYRYANAAFSGDAALISQAGEEAYQISLGRFLQPLWWRIRGTVTAPFLIGLFCLIFLVFSGCLTARILRIRNRAGIVFSCGIQFRRRWVSRMRRICPGRLAAQWR